ncbi:hypothetical protein [Streptomyces sp. NRRL B-24484]|uniref:hypothetical protein n=1 Tax=Streptomyces sp. NRRL B-24484 TaxID=1463833 RepID=UPI0005BDBC19|nr:hypothetical protein [Streptomyces sp. NRRL B-24484]
MSRRTPPRPEDPASVLPELAGHGRTATRLHPRPGSPGVGDSSVSGPLLWPADEPWPTCTEPHPRGHGYLLRDAERRRTELYGPPRRRVSPEGRLVPFHPMPHALHRPDLADTDPVPLLAVAQLYRRDVPDLPAGPDGCDLLQVLWCPFSLHGPDQVELEPRLYWRRSEEVREVLAPAPRPEVVGAGPVLTGPCVLHPERITEYPDLPALPEALAGRLTGADAERYRTALSVAPGWKAGGYPYRHRTSPPPDRCGCGAALTLLLAATHGEWDPDDPTWQPVEDRPGRVRLNAPTGFGVCDGSTVQIFVCADDPSHPHLTWTHL